MKHLFLLAFTALIFASCKKEWSNHSYQNEFPSKIKAILKDSLSQRDFQLLNFSNAVASFERDSAVLIRIPFAGKNSSEDYVLLQTDENWNVQKGRIIHIKGEISQGRPDRNSGYHFTGVSVISFLNGQRLLESPIEHGYIVHKQSGEVLTTAPPAMEDPYITLPEVVVVSSYSSGGGGVSYSTWISLTSLMGNGGGGGYYSSYDPGYNSGGGGGGGSYSGGSGTSSSGGGTVATQPTIRIDYETVEDKSPIDLQKFINCFSTVPDAGAQCTIEIFTDIPVDSDPKKFFNWDNQSPGHTFIQIKKSNGSNSIMQNIGFYPNKNWKTILSPTAIEGKFVDNGNHEFNASIKMNVSPADFQSMLNYIIYMSRYVKYDIDDYNCTDWALQVFNLTRSDKLIIPKYKIPGGATPSGTSTPQGLYEKIKQMKDMNHPESKNITVGIVKGWVARSHGACN